VNQPEERLPTTFKVLIRSVNDHLEHGNEGGEVVDKMSHRGGNLKDI
jgi:hypothetical protein